MRRALIALVLLLATPVLAAEHGGAEGEKKKGKEAVGQYVDISTVALPVIWQGKLINYIFVSLRVNLNKSADAVALREKEPYFRDALVRGAHRTPFTNPKNFAKLDEAAMKQFMMREAARIAGPRAVANIEIVTAQPQHMSGLPKPPG